ncbi:MAG: PKD domain-containing protein [Bacteroidia bacterium]|nr:PKD domain-containing protein [Bacteroidia bacterium]
MKKNRSNPLWYLVIPLLFLLGPVSTINAQSCNPEYEIGNECVDEGIQFKANALGFSDYEWEFRDAANALVGTSDDRDPVYVFDKAGVYKVTLVATGPAGKCTNEISITIKPSPIADLRLISGQQQCFEGNEFCFVDNSTPAPGSTIVRRCLVTDDGGIYCDVNPKQGDTICHRVQDTRGGWFGVKLELEDANGCVTEYYLKDAFRVFPKLGISISSNSPVKCDSTMATITNNTYVNWKSDPDRYIGLKDVAEFVFDFGDGPSTTVRGDSITNTEYWTGKALDGLITHWYRTNGTFDATLSVTSKYGCSEKFTYRSAATNIKLNPIIVSDKDSTCTGEPEICFSLKDGPIPGARFLWNFGHPESGPMNTDDKSWMPCHRYGGGPYMASLRIWSGPCFIVAFDTNFVIGPSSIIEVPDDRVLEKEKYQCTITDTVHLVNHSKFYHNDPNPWDEDSVLLAYKESFMVVTHPVTQLDSVYVYENKRNTLTNMDKLKGKYALSDVLNLRGHKVYFDQTQDSFVVVNANNDTTRYGRNLGGVDVKRLYVFEWFSNNTGSQVAIPNANQMRNRDHVERLWSLGDTYAPQCTTDSRANKNVGLNCNFTRDSMPAHWYKPWDEVYMYENNGQFYRTPAPRTMFSRNARQCFQVQVFPADTVRIPKEVVLFVPKDSTKTFTVSYVDSFGVAKTEDITVEAGKTYPEAQIRDNYRLKIWRPMSVYKGEVISTVIWEDHDYYVPAGITVKIKNLQNGSYRSVTGPKRETIKKDEQFEIAAGDSILSLSEMVENAARQVIAGASTVIVDTVINGKATTISRQVVVVDPAYHRSYFYQNRASCNTVSLFHKDVVHPMACEHTDNISLALIPPSAKGLKWKSGIPCPLDGSKLQYYLEFDMSGTKPGCTQQWFEVNYDSATGPMNWVSYKSGSVFAPPAPGTATPFTADYQKVGAYGTTFVKGYSPGEIGNDPSRRPGGWFTMGLVVGNGQPMYDPAGNPVAPECTDTAWYTKMFQYQFLDAQYDVLVPNNWPYTLCAGETIYFRLVNPIQDSMAALRWNWGYPDRLSGYYEQFQYFQKYTGPVKGRNDENVDWNSSDNWLYNYVIRHNLDEVYGDVTLDTIVTKIYREWKSVVNTSQSNDYIDPRLIQLGLDPTEVSGEDLALMLGDGSFGCIDTTGISQFFTIGLEGLDENVVEHGRYKYKYTDLNKTDSVIVEEVLHFRDYSMQGFDTLIAQQDLRAPAADTVFKAGSVIPGVYKFTYRHPEVRRNFCDPSKRDTVWVNSSGAMVPNLTLNNRVGCEKTAANFLTVGYLNKFKLVNDAVCEKEAHVLYDSIRYWQAGMNDPDNYPIDTRKYWEDPDRYANGKLETKAIDWDYRDGVDKFDRSISFQHQYDEPGEYLVAIATKDSMGCRDTATVTAFVTGVKANFETNLNAGSDLCDGVVIFYDSSIVFDPCRGRDTCPNGAYEPCDSVISYEWDFGDGSIRSVLKNPAHDYTSSGWFTVRLIVETLLGCQDTIEKRIFLAGPQPRFEFAENDVWGGDSIVICVGDSAHLRNTSIEPIYDPNWVVYWGDTANSQSSSKNRNTIFSHQYNEEGVYYLEMFMEDEVEAGKPPCTRIFPDPDTSNGKTPRRIKVVVRPIAPARLEISDTVVCPDQLVTFTSNSDEIYTSYQWVFGDGDTSTRIDPTNFVTRSYKQPGTYDVKLIPNYELDPGSFGPKCIDTAYGSVTVVDVVADFDIDEKDKPEFCFINTSKGASNFEWSIEMENRDTTKEYTSGVDETICYNWGEEVGNFAICLVATNEIGCADTACKVIYNDFRIGFTPYNVFTPNGENLDGLNDKFVIEIDGWEEFEINIYNRWGELVFNTFDPAQSWDGTIMNKGTECPGGTYFYVINYKLKNRELNDGLEPVSGTVTLIR